MKKTRQGQLHLGAFIYFTGIIMQDGVIRNQG